jgi:hypothetical protein
MPTENLESTGTTLDGTPIALRPIRPEDEPVLQDLFAHMSLEDVRLRFFAPMRELSHALAARLSHLEYGREMALVAQHDGMTLGVARYSADPDRLSAEFEARFELVDLRRQRHRVGGVALKHFDRHRAAIGGAQQAVDDLQLLSFRVVCGVRSDFTKL